MMKHKYNVNEYNMVKNSNWQEVDQLAQGLNCDSLVADAT